MSKIILRHSLLTVTVTALSLAVIAPLTAALPARAMESEAETQTNTQEQETETQATETQDTETANTETQDKRATAEDKKANAETHLTTVKLKVCQNREKAITNIMARISDRGQKRVDLFSTIAERTETFYTNKGKTLSSYDSLVADVAAKKADAQTAVNTTKSAAAEFTCDSTNPKGIAATFKTDLHAQNDALKAYKTAVKNLIVGVKSVQGSTTSTDKNSSGGAQ